MLLEIRTLAFNPGTRDPPPPSLIIIPAQTRNHDQEALIHPPNRAMGMEEMGREVLT